MLELTNTLGHKKQQFKPITPGMIHIYTCGPTVYDDIHIGNLRAFVTPDILKRVLQWNGYNVNHVMNITDVGIGGDNDEGEDKIVKGLKREGKPITLAAMKELTEFYTEHFKADLSKLNIIMPNVFPKASEHIQEDIELIQVLEKKDIAYAASDAVYFDTSKVANYGKLGGLTNDDESIARIASSDAKRNRRDFALWKLNSSLGYESPWGVGFPGWHIECSAMSRKYLGDHFDIHTGGIDLATIHHNNEIAQSESACGCDFVNFWVHNAFVNVEGGKMSKSEGTGLTLATLIEKGFDPLAYRYFLLGAHYKTPITFSWMAIEGAQNALRKLQQAVNELPHGGSIDSAYQTAYEEKINDDLDTPGALALVWQLLKDGKVSPADKKATIIDFDRILGLGLDKEISIEIPEHVQKLAEEREEARKNKDWALADQLREKIELEGFVVKDIQPGFKLQKKSY